MVGVGKPLYTTARCGDDETGRSSCRSAIIADNQPSVLRAVRRVGDSNHVRRKQRIPGRRARRHRRIEVANRRVETRERDEALDSLRCRGRERDEGGDDGNEHGASLSVGWRTRSIYREFYYAALSVSGRRRSS